MRNVNSISELHLHDLHIRISNSHISNLLPFQNLKRVYHEWSMPRTHGLSGIHGPPVFLEFLLAGGFLNFDFSSRISHFLFGPVQGPTGLGSWIHENGREVQVQNDLRVNHPNYFLTKSSHIMTFRFCFFDF